MLSVAEQYKGNNNFEYDLVDIVRQSNADKEAVLPSNRFFNGPSDVS